MPDAEPNSPTGLQGRKILLGVSSSIALHRALDIASAIVKQGGEVQVLMTEEATNLIRPLAFEAITHRRAVVSLWDSPASYEMDHLEFTKWAELMILAPATANLIAQAALGLAGDVLTTAILAWTGPTFVAPAMNPAMWRNLALQENVAKLRARGFEFIGPVEGKTACGDIGAGRMAPVEDILRKITARIGQIAARTSQQPSANSIAGKRILITSGPTREYFDPVRFLSNPSSGKMGHALAEEAARRGAKVVLVHGPVALPDPDGVEQSISVTTAEEMCDAVMKFAPAMDMFVFAAAVSDWRPAQRLDRKQKKEANGQAASQIQLVRNPDIALKTLEAARPGAFRVGFAAETHDLRANAETKRREKKFDLLVANNVMLPDSGFAANYNQAWFLTEGQEPRALPGMTKADLSREIYNEIERILEQRAPSKPATPVTPSNAKSAAKSGAPKKQA